MNEITSHPGDVPESPGPGSRGPRVPRPGWALGAVGVVAAVAAVAAVAVVAAGGNGGGRAATTAAPPAGEIKLVSAEQVFGLASNAAAAAPDLKPRPDQYLYFTSKSTQTADGPGMQTGSTARKVWLSVSGKHAGLLDQTSMGSRMYLWLCDGADSAKTKYSGDLKVDLAHPPTGCTNDQPAYDPTIPTDPAAAKAWIYKHNNGGNPPDVQAFTTVGDTIRERYIGSKSLAALFKAAAQIPGVKVYKNVKDAAGRTGIAVGQTWNGYRRELIFDSTTFKLLGESTVTDSNATFHPKGGKPTQAADAPRRRDGIVIYASAQLTFAVVDHPGQTP